MTNFSSYKTGIIPRNSLDHPSQFLAVPSRHPKPLHVASTIKAKYHAKTSGLETKSKLESAIRPKSPSLVSSAHGQFKEILLTIPSYVVKGDPEDPPQPLQAVYKQLMGNGEDSLPIGCKIVVYVHQSIYQIVQTWAAKNREVEYILVDDDQSFSIWAEDGYTIVYDKSSKGANGDTWFASPWTFLRYADGIIASNVSNASTDPRRKNFSTPLIFQGGNCLIGDDFFFIGFDYAIGTMGLMGGGVIRSDNPENQSAEQIVKEVKDLYRKYLDDNRDLFFIGNFENGDETKPMPCPTNVVTHFTKINDGKPEDWKLNLYFGNGGGHTMLSKSFPPVSPFKEGVYEPIFHIDMFISLAGENKDGDYVVLVGSPAEAYKIIYNKKELTQEDYENDMLRYSMQEVFDNIANYIAKLPKKKGKFKVIRTPLPLVYMEQEKTRTFYFATSNNCLVQINGDDKDVWLPTYAHDAWKDLLRGTDDKMEEIWTGLGFKVHKLPNFHPFAQNLGALHCIKKYLRRSPNNIG